MNLAAAAAKSITGMYLGGKIIISKSTVAMGFFIVNPTSPVVATHIQNIISTPVNRLNAAPIQMPQKMTGKK